MSLHELVDVDTVNPGDLVYLPKLGAKLVDALERHDDGTIVVVYYDDEESSYENRARDHSGFNHRARLVLKSLRPLQPGDLLEVERGNPAAAKQRRARLEREQAERWAAAEERQRRAAARDRKTRRDLDD